MGEAWKRFRRNRVALGALVVLVLLIAMAIAAPWLSPFDPSAQFFDGLTLQGAPLPPGGKYFLGTDLLGRDLLSRLIFGARASLEIGVAANLAAGALGALGGVTPGGLLCPHKFPLIS